MEPRWYSQCATSGIFPSRNLPYIPVATMAWPSRFSRKQTKGVAPSQETDCRSIALTSVTSGKLIERWHVMLIRKSDGAKLIAFSRESRSRLGGADARKRGSKENASPGLSAAAIQFRIERRRVRVTKAEARAAGACC